MTHREKIYAAHHRAFGVGWSNNHTLKTMAEVADCVGITCDFVCVNPQLEESECWWERYDWWEPWLPKVFIHSDERQTPWIIHELAHVLQGPYDRREHSRRWVACLLILVRRLNRALGCSQGFAKRVRAEFVPLVPKTLSK